MGCRNRPAGPSKRQSSWNLMGVAACTEVGASAPRDKAAVWAWNLQSTAPVFNNRFRCTKPGVSMSIRKFALSVLALSAAAASQSQSSYNVYGVVDLSVGSMQLSGLPTAADNKRITKVDGNNMVTSYLGFKGLEDLGGGLKATTQV